jgi:hypothetical protein
MTWMQRVQLRAMLRAMLRDGEEAEDSILRS